MPFMDELEAAEARMNNLRNANRRFLEAAQPNSETWTHGGSALAMKRGLVNSANEGNPDADRVRESRPVKAINRGGIPRQKAERRTATFACEQCHRSFQSKAMHPKYCSDKCSRKAQRQRRSNTEAC